MSPFITGVFLLLLPATCIARRQHGSQLSLRAGHHREHAAELNTAEQHDSQLSIRAGHHQEHAAELNTAEQHGSQLSLRAGNHQEHAEELKTAVPTPPACSAYSRRYVGDNIVKMPPQLPNAQSCTGAVAAANWITCPSRSRDFKECSYYCPANTYTQYQKPPSKDKTCPAGTGSPPPAKPEWKISSAHSICMQLDMNSWGNIIGLNFGFGVSAILESGGRMIIEGFLGAGITLGLVLVKGSGYIQGTVSMTVQLPVSERTLFKGLKYAATEVYHKLKKNTPLGRFVDWVDKVKGKKSALEKMVSISTKEALKHSLKFYAMQTKNSWVPYSCSRSHRGFGAENTPPRFPNDRTCEAKLPAGWLKCPSRSRDFLKCSYYCPSSLRTEQAVPRVACKVTAQFTQEDASRTYGRILRHSAREQRNAFMALFVKGAPELLKKKKLPQKDYWNYIEMCWRNLYLDQPINRAYYTNAVSRLFQTTTQCAKLDSSSGDGTRAIKQIFCEFMIVGWLLPGKDVVAKGTGDTNANIRAMLPKMYPELFPWQVAANGEDSDKLDMDKAKDVLRNAGTWKYNNMFVTGISTLLSVPASDLPEVLERLAQPAPSEDSCDTGIVAFEGQITMGFTAGHSGVGFCTPDNNPIQYTRTKSWTILRQQSKKRGKCEYALQSSDGWAHTVTFTASIYFALAITRWDKAINNKRYDVQFRFRIDMDINDNETIDDDTSTSTNRVLAWFENTLLKFNGGGDNQGNWLKGVDSAIKNFFNGQTIFTELRKTTQGSVGGFMKALHDGLGTCPGAHGILGAVFKATVVKGLEALGADAITGGYTSKQLMGFDIQRERDGVWTLSLVSQRYRGISSPGAPVAPGFTLTASGYEGSENRFEYKREGWLQAHRKT